jgi:hypothetical protein
VDEAIWLASALALIEGDGEFADPRLWRLEPDNDQQAL